MLFGTGSATKENRVDLPLVPRKGCGRRAYRGLPRWISCVTSHSPATVFLAETRSSSLPDPEGAMQENTAVASLVTAWFKDKGRPEATCLGRSFVYSSLSATVRGIRAAFGLRVFS